MSWGISAQLIKGLMFGIEYAEDDEEGFFYIVFDIGFIRFLYFNNGE